MPNIVLSRIDERLIHGQVGVQWVGFAGANLVLVANDEVAEDPVQQKGSPYASGHCKRSSTISTAPPIDKRFCWSAKHQPISYALSKAEFPSHVST